MVCPFGCVCHAVRAPGVKWTLLALRRDCSDGVATASMYTLPVNHSLGPAFVSVEFLVMFMASSRALPTRTGDPLLARPPLALHGQGDQKNHDSNDTDHVRHPGKRTGHIVRPYEADNRPDEEQSDHPG